MSTRECEIFRDALDHIMKVAGQAHRPTVRLDWIRDRARLALSGKAYDENIMPKYPKNRSNQRSADRVLPEMEMEKGGDGK